MAKNTDISNEEVEQDHIGGADEMVDEGAISNATPEGKCPVDTPDDEVSTQSGEKSDEGAISNATPDEESESPDGESDDEPDTFSREYVQKLRDESARYRQRAGRADELAHSLHKLLVEQTGRLADPSDLNFDEAHLEDPESLTASIDDLLSTKPHLATRIARGDIEQGATPSDPEFSLTGIMRNHA
ncbi:MAG: hypothetical protein L0G54_09165 [Brevibacterium sp.]|nr:hypothetical protein [Brevibacterium sp.]